MVKFDGSFSGVSHQVFPAKAVPHAVLCGRQLVSFSLGVPGFF
jgi:hypothetical protein